MLFIIPDFLTPKIHYLFSVKPRYSLFIIQLPPPNIADKNACFLINCQILVTGDTEKQTLPLAGYKLSHNRSLKGNSFCKTEKENLFMCSLKINGNEAETKVKESNSHVRKKSGSMVWIR